MRRERKGVGVRLKTLTSHHQVSPSRKLWNWQAVGPCWGARGIVGSEHLALCCHLA